MRSLEWSPGRKRLAYAGELDACKIVREGKAGKEDKNELFVWDAEKKSVQRLASAVSAFETLWLDDDHLIYEGGIGKEGKLRVRELSTGKDTALKPRAGAGIYGYPTLACLEEEASGLPPGEDDGGDRE